MGVLAFFSVKSADHILQRTQKKIFLTNVVEFIIFLMLTKTAFIWSKIQENYIVEYYCNFK